MMHLLGFMTIRVSTLAGLLLLGATVFAQIAPEATTYTYKSDALQFGSGPAFMPLAWTCGPWSAWQILATYCVGHATCPDGCPVRAKLMYRTQTCTDEGGVEIVNEEQGEFYSGCCTGGPGGQCPDPLAPSPSTETQRGGDVR